MIIRYPKSKHHNVRDGRMISFIDMAPTLLSLAKIQPPKYMQGKAFIGHHQRLSEPTYVFGAADRFDETTDKVRSVRGKQYKYIKYYEPEKPMYLEVGYRNQMPIMQELLRLKKEGSLTKEQALWFRERKPNEELFDVQNDPYELHDLSKDPTYKSKLEEMRVACDQWIVDINDTGMIPEETLIANIHPQGFQPQTDPVQAKKRNGIIELSSTTAGASVGYKIIKPGVDSDELSWMIYSEPIQLSENEKLLTVAHRIGFRPSDVVKVN